MAEHRATVSNLTFKMDCFDFFFNDTRLGNDKLPNAYHLKKEFVEVITIMIIP